MSTMLTSEICHAIVVDDEPSVVEIVANVLEHSGLTVHRAFSGEEALDIFSSRIIDIVFTDIRMNGISGFELMRRMHMMDDAVKVVVMTGYDSYGMLRRALHAGAYDYLSKPLDNHELIVSIAVRAFESSRLIRENKQLIESLTASHSRLSTANTRLVTLNRRLRLLAITDVLTRLYNRRYIDQTIDKEAQRRDRYASALSVLVLDVDNFKLFNDTHGHDGGDSVLQNVAATLRRCIRKSDIVGRYGGEEFVVVLPDTTPENARFFAERLRYEIEADRTELATGIGQVTVSIGIAGVAASDGSISGKELIIEADRALYTAKEAGKNRVVLFDDLESSADCPLVSASQRTGTG
ncbi:MAG: diguanylate cyclase [Granulosicoccus sp.]